MDVEIGTSFQVSDPLPYCETLKTTLALDSASFPLTHIALHLEHISHDGHTKNSTCSVPSKFQPQSGLLRGDT